MTFSRLRSPVALLVLGVLLVMAGGWALRTESARAAKGRAVAERPTVEGEVIYSGVDRRVPLAQQRLSFWPFSAASGVQHRAVVRYRYAVGGTPYLSDQLAPFDSARGHTTAEQARLEAARYPVGTSVQVSFDPIDPGNAVLESGYRPGLWRLALGGFGLLAGLSCLVGAGVWQGRT